MKELVKPIVLGIMMGTYAIAKDKQKILKQDEILQRRKYNEKQERIALREKRAEAREFIKSVLENTEGPVCGR